MHAGIHNFSEIGKLNKVLLHRPGEELEALTPSTIGRLLFDDIPYLRLAQAEHDAFARVLRDNGVEVVYYVDELTRALESDRALQPQLINEFLDVSKIASQGLRESISDYLLAMPPRDMVGKLIAGIRRGELAEHAPTSLVDLREKRFPFVSDPMPNLYFTRDPGVCVGSGISIHRMHFPARRREALLLRYIFRYAPGFAAPDDRQWYDPRGPYSLEGGDILVLSDEVVAVGLSQRTTSAGAEAFARALLSGSGFKRVLAFDIPDARAFMHLDTVFTMVDYDKFTIHPEIEGPLSVYEITLGANGALKFDALKEELSVILAHALGLGAVELLRCGGGDLLAAQREQWSDGANTLAIAPGKVITYERNYVTNELLARHGCTVITIPSSELARGRGGPHCMSCSIHRDDL